MDKPLLEIRNLQIEGHRRSACFYPVLRQ